MLLSRYKNCFALIARLQMTFCTNDVRIRYYKMHLGFENVDVCLFAVLWNLVWFYERFLNISFVLSHFSTYCNRRWNTNQTNLSNLYNGPLIALELIETS